jgi:hypothetical protein
LAERGDHFRGGDRLTKAVSEMQRLPELDRPATRSEIATWFARLLPETPSRTADINLYADIPDEPTRQAAARLARVGITAAIWDASASYAPEGKLYFRPNAPLNHSELFFVLYLIDKINSPLVADPPADFKNGREPL